MPSYLVLIFQIDLQLEYPTRVACCNSLSEIDINLTYSLLRNELIENLKVLEERLKWIIYYLTFPLNHIIEQYFIQHC